MVKKLIRAAALWMVVTISYSQFTTLGIDGAPTPGLGTSLMYTVDNSGLVATAAYFADGTIYVFGDRPAQSTFTTQFPTSVQVMSLRE